MNNEINEIIEAAILSVEDISDADAVEDAVFSCPEFCPHFGEFGDIEEGDIVAATLTVLKGWYEDGFLVNRPAFLVA